MLYYLQRVRRPISNPVEGFCSDLQAKDLAVNRVCQSCTLTSLRVSAFHGSPHLWVNPVSWVCSSPLVGSAKLVPIGGYSFRSELVRFNVEDRGQNLVVLVGKLVSPTSKEGFQAFDALSAVSMGNVGFSSSAGTTCAIAGNVELEKQYADNRWVPPWEGFEKGVPPLLNVLKPGSGSVSSSYWSLITFVPRSIDQHWAPPWWRLIPGLGLYKLRLVILPKTQLLGLITHILDALSMLGLYVLVKCFKFLQGLSSHLVFKFCWTAKMCVITALVFLMRMLGMKHLGEAARHSVLDNMVPPPPPAPNIPWEALSVLHQSCQKDLMSLIELLRPILIWFEFSGLQPPWQTTVCSSYWFRCLQHGMIASYRDFLKQAVGYAARKHCRVVQDGTCAQVFAFVVCCLSVRLGSYCIEGHGWELVSTDVKTLVLCVAKLAVKLICKLISKMLYFVFELCREFVQLLCKLLE